MDAAFYRAALPEPFTICKVTLRPFSLGHAILFKRCGLPFLDNSDEPTKSDFINALILCACRYEEAVEVFQDPNFYKTLKRWIKRVGTINLEEKVNLFYDYLKYHLDNVPLFARPEHGAPVEAPFEQVIKVTLMSKCNRTESEALNMPYSLAVWDFLTFKAIDNQIQLLDRGNEAIRREDADKFHEKWKARINGRPS